METTQPRKNALGRLLIIVVLLLLLIGPLFNPVPGFLISQFGLNTSVLLLLLFFIIGFSIIIIIALSMEKKVLGKIVPFIRELGLGAPTRWLPAIVGALVGILWGILLMMSYLQFNPQANLMEINSLRVLAAILAAFGALLEDIVTRGYLMNRLDQIKVPLFAQVLLSALIFALYHTIWGFNPISFIFSVVYGLILSGLFLWGRRSLTPVILGHSLAVLLGEPFASLLLFMAP